MEQTPALVGAARRPQQGEVREAGVVSEAFLEEVGGRFTETGVLLGGSEVPVDATADTPNPAGPMFQVQVMDPLRPPKLSRHQNPPSLALRASPCGCLTSQSRLSRESPRGSLGRRQPQLSRPHLPPSWGASAPARPPHPGLPVPLVGAGGHGLKLGGRAGAGGSWQETQETWASPSPPLLSLRPPSLAHLLHQMGLVFPDSSPQRCCKVASSPTGDDCGFYCRSRLWLEGGLLPCTLWRGPRGLSWAWGQASVVCPGVRLRGFPE